MRQPEMDPNGESTQYEEPTDVEFRASENEAKRSPEQIKEDIKADIDAYMEQVEIYKKEAKQATEKKAKEFFSSIVDSLQESLGNAQDELAKLEDRLDK